MPVGERNGGIVKELVLVVLNFSRKKRPSWCQQGKEIEGIVNESLVLRWERKKKKILGIFICEVMLHLWI